jgi:hypothetical protein
MNWSLSAAGGAIVAAALLAAGCGGGGTTSTTSPTVDWANNLCSATTTWKDALSSAASSLKNGPYTSATLDAAAGQAKDATQTFLDSLKGLGKPDTPSGQDAKSAVDSLQSQLQSDLDTMQKATANVSGASAVLNAISVVSGTLVTMGNQVKSTVSTLQQSDVSGDLKNAFDQADACAPYQS